MALNTMHVLTILRIRQWSTDRAMLHKAKASNPRHSGWQQRDDRNHDARLVRVIDFERCLHRLTENEQIALVLQYREKQTAEMTAQIIGCSPRHVFTLTERARQHLADELDRAGIL